MVARLQKIDAVASHKVDQTVLIRDPARPSSGQKMSQRFGLASAGEWLTQHCFDQIQDPHGDLAIGCNPIAKILAEFRVENGLSWRPRLLRDLTAS